MKPVPPRIRRRRGEGVSPDAILAMLGSAAKLLLPGDKTKVAAAPAAENLIKSLRLVGIGIFDGGSLL